MKASLGLGRIQGRELESEKKKKVLSYPLLSAAQLLRL